MKLYSWSGRLKRDAQGNYTPWGSPPSGGQWANPGAINAYAKHYTQFKKAYGRGTPIDMTYDQFKENWSPSGGSYASPQNAMKQQVPQAPNMMGQQSTFSQQNQSANKNNTQMQGYMQQIQRTIQQLQQQLKQMQQGY